MLIIRFFILFFTLFFCNYIIPVNTKNIDTNVCLYFNCPYEKVIMSCFYAFSNNDHDNTDNFNTDNFNTDNGKYCNKKK